MEPKVRLHHIAISVEDLERSVSWYKEMMGLSEIRRMTIEHNGTKIAFMGNEQFVIEILEVPGHKPIPKDRSHPDEDNATCGVKHFCIIADGNIEYIEWLKSKGAKIVFEFQPGGIESYAAFINDPDGNVIEVFDTNNLVAGQR